MAAPICPTCGTAARLTDGAEIYPHRRDLADKPIWACTIIEATELLLKAAFELMESLFDPSFFLHKSSEDHSSIFRKKIVSSVGLLHWPAAFMHSFPCLICREAFRLPVFQAANEWNRRNTEPVCRVRKTSPTLKDLRVAPWFPERMRKRADTFGRGVVGGKHKQTALPRLNSIWMGANEVIHCAISNCYVATKIVESKAELGQLRISSSKILYLSMCRVNYKLPKLTSCRHKRNNRGSKCNNRSDQSLIPVKPKLEACARAKGKWSTGLASQIRKSTGPCDPVEGSYREQRCDRACNGKADQRQGTSAHPIFLTICRAFRARSHAMATLERWA
jgi:hypothetical protein